MAVKVRTKAKAKATVKAASKATATKRVNHSAETAKLRKEVASRLNKGAKLSDVADALHITAGKAAFLNMINEVEAGSVPRISTSGGDDATAKRIVAARDKQDAHSSWGWIAARTGFPEAKVKALAEAAGAKVKGSHVARERAAANGGGKAKAKAAKKGKAVKAKAKATDPSK